MQDLTPRLAQLRSYGSATGVVVAERQPDSPSSKAGIRAGDLLMEADRQPITSVADYEQALKRAKPGGTILLRVRRGRSIAYIPVSVPE